MGAVGWATVIVAALGLAFTVWKWPRERGEDHRQTLWEYRPEFFRGLENAPHRGRASAGRCQAEWFYLQAERQSGPIHNAWRRAPSGFRKRYEEAQHVLSAGWKSEIDEEKQRQDRDAATKAQVDAQMRARELLGKAWEDL